MTNRTWVDQAPLNNWKKMKNKNQCPAKRIHLHLLLPIQYIYLAFKKMEVEIKTHSFRYGSYILQVSKFN
ncbi:hypothetical protein CISIN_1g035254mg [Citrus sinensis]|uniref:Uncharacterized protein n=1 Tax=Citrus sinensis TaxID=2711 RepID=A0A067DG12_CITSI|nr:hypothetical protein CISIN_1g035254mg [Citrus sinensis]